MGYRNVNVAAAGVAEIAHEKMALRTRYHFKDDFDQYQAGALNPYWASGCGGAGTAAIAASTHHGGAITLDSVGAVAGVDIGGLLGPQYSLDFALEPEFWFLFSPRHVLQVGHYFGIQKDANEYAYLRYDTSLGDASWQFASDDAGVTGPTTVSSGVVPVAGRWYELRMNVRLVGGAYKVYAKLYDLTAPDVSRDGLLLTTGSSLISGDDTHRAFLATVSQGAIVQSYVDYYQVFARRWA